MIKVLSFNVLLRTYIHIIRLDYLLIMSSGYSVGWLSYPGCCWGGVSCHKGTVFTVLALSHVAGFRVGRVITYLVHVLPNIVDHC